MPVRQSLPMISEKPLAILRGIRYNGMYQICITADVASMSGKDCAMNQVSPSASIIAASTNGELVCASAGRISTTQGTSLEILERSKLKENNAALIEKVVASGHQSLIEHAFFTIAFDSVSVCTEEFVIEFRLASFTVQSRRYVDFTNVGCYTPELPDDLIEPYRKHMTGLFDTYAKLLALDIPKEDARFVLPYSFRSNFYCTMNARELMHMISSMLWGRGSRFPELKSLGESLRTQFEQYFPNLLNRMESRFHADQTRYALPESLPDLPMPSCREASVAVLSTTEDAVSVLNASASANGMLTADTGSLSLREIVHGERPRELELLHTTFRIENLSLAAVTHLVRHRIQSVLVPQVMQAVQKNTYLLPPTIAQNPEAKALYEAAFTENSTALREFLKNGLPISAVQYFALAGNQLDVVCSMNGRELKHFFALRTCRRAQWEIRAAAVSLLKQLRRHTPDVYRLMGPSCYVTGKCPEGRLSCGQADLVRREFEETE